MEIRHLKLIKTLAEVGNMTKATEDLYLTQSALSRQLKEIESQLGVRLFDRVNKRLKINRYGKRLVKSANIILQEVAKVHCDLLDMTSSREDRITISTQCYTNYNWLPELIEKLSYEYPKFEVIIDSSSTGDQLKYIMNKQLDVGITHQLIENDELQYEFLFEDELLAVISKRHPLAKRDYLRAKDFENETMFIPAFPKESLAIFSNFLIPKNIKLKDVVVIPLTEATTSMIKANQGISVFARWIIKPLMNDSALQFIRINKNGLYRKWYGVYRKDNPNKKQVVNFIDGFKNYHTI